MKRGFACCLLLSVLLCSTTALAESHRYELTLAKNIQLVLEEEDIDPRSCKAACTPNGEPVFGTEKAPVSYVKHIQLIVDDKQYTLNSRNMYNAWNDRPVKIENGPTYLAAHCYDKSNCTIRGVFSDTSGSYVAEWIIDKGKPFRSVLSYSHDVLNLFLNHIGPPIFD